MLAMANDPNAGTGWLGLGCVDVSLQVKRLESVGAFDNFLLAAPFRFDEVVDFFPLEEGIPTLANAVRLVLLFLFDAIL